jgi:hypothetical protein
MQESLGLDCKKVYTNVSCYHKTEPAAISVWQWRTY